MAASHLRQTGTCTNPTAEAATLLFSQLARAAQHRDGITKYSSPHPTFWENMAQSSWEPELARLKGQLESSLLHVHSELRRLEAGIQESPSRHSPARLCDDGILRDVTSASGTSRSGVLELEVTSLRRQCCELETQMDERGAMVGQLLCMHSQLQVGPLINMDLRRSALRDRSRPTDVQDEVDELRRQACALSHRAARPSPGSP